MAFRTKERYSGGLVKDMVGFTKSRLDVENCDVQPKGLYTVPSKLNNSLG